MKPHCRTLSRLTRLFHLGEAGAVGEAALGILALLAIFGGVVAELGSPLPSTKSGEQEFRQEFIRSQMKELEAQLINAPAVQEQPRLQSPPPELVRTDSRNGFPIAPIWSTLGVRPNAAEDPLVAAPPPPPEPPKTEGDVSQPDQGGSTWDACQAQKSPDGQWVPGTCTKPWHGTGCTAAAAH